MSDPEPELSLAPDCGNSPKNARAQDVALALMGAGAIDPDLLAENAVWERPGGAVSGRAAILGALRRTRPPTRIEVDQVVTHGRSGSVSGRAARQEDERLFCHVIRYTTAACREIAQLVSFEHQVKRR
ncbi:nuclear transport factor 2 family protein [Pseudooceanicola onchidii]|uniref:nuclear transport factor 2 family protein n=1 Tax=Pseudooceanicola onchidii TaxID=2562279 RepID=UPI0010AAD8A4|nr:nuclear transport factor 2 family protein [Pseudooceanicola onchidii]